MMLDHDDFEDEVTPTTVAEIAPLVVAQARTPFDLVSKLRYKFLARACSLLIGNGATRESSPELLSIKLQRLYVLYPGMWILSGSTFNNHAKLRTFTITDDGEIVFPNRPNREN